MKFEIRVRHGDRAYMNFSYTTGVWYFSFLSPLLLKVLEGGII